MNFHVSSKMVDESVDLSAIEVLTGASIELHEAINSLDTYDDRKRVLYEVISSGLPENTKRSTISFKKGLEWLNVSRPLTHLDLKGRVVVLDFFTYCCINCMHILPYLKKVEEQFSTEDGLIVIGVHSAKFENEKSSENISSALKRYSVTHPVVNDAEATLWRTLGITCWPTLVILDPKTEPIFVLIGEESKHLIRDYIKAALTYYKETNELNVSTRIPLSPDTQIPDTWSLYFPGKVCLAGNKIVVSDTGHHRILVCSLNGNVHHVIGKGESGFKDGYFNEAAFNSPQGVAYLPPSTLFVADNENHAIRQVDLNSGQVTTLSGTGIQGNDNEGGQMGPEQILSSPWDVCLGKTSTSITSYDVVYVAMAGTHQIWAYFLQDGTLWNKLSYKRGTMVRVAGSGLEENRNNSYPHKAGFAQPSGLSYREDTNILYIADSESSSVRQINLNNGTVTGVVGGNKNPQDLFFFGDMDGNMGHVKLQHPLAVAWNGTTNMLYVADSYNHKIKMVEVNKKTCNTLCLTKDAKLNEPGGICCSEDGKHIFVADTNNHCIKVIDLDTKSIQKLEIMLPSTETDSAAHSVKPDESKSISVGSLGAHVSINMSIKLSDGLEYSPPPAKQTYTIDVSQLLPASPKINGNFTAGSAIKFEIPPNITGSKVVSVTLNLIMCDDAKGFCFMKMLSYKINVQFDSSIKKAESIVVHFSTSVANTSDAGTSMTGV